MARSLHRRQYDIFRKLLVDTRRSSGLTQDDVAKALSKPQSFVSKYERGERRLDFTEAIEICAALSLDPHALITSYLEKEP